MKILWKPLVYVCVYIAILGAITVTKHMLFHTYAFDLGIFIQALYTTWKGQGLLFETPDAIISNSYLGIHFSPILFFIVPLVGLFPPGETLLLFQTTILALPAYFLYRDVYLETRSKMLSNLISLWYLFNPALHCINLYDFHTQSLMILPAYFLIKAMKNQNAKKSSIFLIILFMISEQALFIGLGCVIYILLIELLYKKSWTKGLISIIIVTVIMSTIAFSTISIIGKPPIHPTNPVKFFPQLGDTWAEVIYNIISWKFLDALLYDIFLKISYWLILLFPLYFWNRKILIREAIPILFPWVLFTLIAGYVPLYTLGWQFSGLILGVVAEVAQEIIKQFKKIALKLYIVGIFLLGLLLSPVSPIPYFLANYLGISRGAAYDFNPILMFTLDELEIASTIRNALSFIPSNASILCTSNIFPHVATRLNAYVGYIKEVPDYILLDYRYVNLKCMEERLLQLVSSLNKSWRYGVMVHANGIILLAHNYTSYPILLKPLKIHTRPDALSWLVDVKFNDEGYAEFNIETDKEKLIWFGPYITLPPGTYEVKVKTLQEFKNKLVIKAVNYISGEILTSSNKDIFQLHVPIDNVIEIKGYSIGAGELVLCGIDIELIDINW